MSSDAPWVTVDSYEKMIGENHSDRIFVRCRRCFEEVVVMLPVRATSLANIVNCMTINHAICEPDEHEESPKLTIKEGLPKGGIFPSIDCKI